MNDSEIKRLIDLAKHATEGCLDRDCTTCEIEKAFINLAQSYLSIKGMPEEFMI